MDNIKSGIKQRDSFYFEITLLTPRSFIHSTQKHRDGIGLNSSFHATGQMVLDSKGFIYLVDDNTVRIIDPELKVTTISRIEGNFKKKEIFSSL